MRANGKCEMANHAGRYRDDGKPSSSSREFMMPPLYTRSVLQNTSRNGVGREDSGTTPTPSPTPTPTPIFRFTDSLAFRPLLFNISSVTDAPRRGLVMMAFRRERFIFVCISTIPHLTNQFHLIVASCVCTRPLLHIYTTVSWLKLTTRTLKNSTQLNSTQLNSVKLNSIQPCIPYSLL